MKIETFPQGKGKTPRIGKGQFASVYAVSEKHAAKVYNFPYPWNCFRDLQEEYHNTLELYNEGISVPEPEGVFRVKIRWTNTLNGYFFPGRTAFVMQRIKGVKADKAEGDLAKKARELFDKEVEKCRKKGFFSGDFRLNNSIYVPAENRIYLVDLADCKRA